MMPAQTSTRQVVLLVSKMIHRQAKRNSNLETVRSHRMGALSEGDRGGNKELAQLWQTGLDQLLISVCQILLSASYVFFAS